MVPVGGKPFLYWQLLYLKEQGVEDVLLLVSYLAEVISGHFTRAANSRAKHSVYALEHPNGNGRGFETFRERIPEMFWLLNGDSFLYTRFDKPWPSNTMPPNIEGVHLPWPARKWFRFPPI